MQVDHRDGDGLNNRRANIRAATVAENQYNGRVRVDNLSGFKGVSFRPKENKWVAFIRANGRNNYLGIFPTPEDAHAAYAKASAQMHGDYGRTA
jgi:hypothetical protein